MILKNRSALFNYFIYDRYVAGIVLLGCEVKSVKAGKVSFNDSYCVLENQELWIRNLHIASYAQQHIVEEIDTKRNRKLLLNKSEVRKIKVKITKKGFTIVPLSLFLEKNKRLIKMEIALAKGKKYVDKRHSIREREERQKIRRITP